MERKTYARFRTTSTLRRKAVRKIVYRRSHMICRDRHFDQQNIEQNGNLRPKIISMWNGTWCMGSHYAGEFSVIIN